MQASLLLNNSIVAGNTAKSARRDIAGYVLSTSLNNLIGDGTGIFGVGSLASGNLIGTRLAPIDPLLRPLGNYGGPTQTMALLPGSPAIDAGNSALVPITLTTDQRGLPRIVHGTVDIGAFESNVEVVREDSTSLSPLT